MSLRTAPNGVRAVFRTTTWGRGATTTCRCRVPPSLLPPRPPPQRPRTSATTQLPGRRPHPARSLDRLDHERPGRYPADLIAHHPVILRTSRSCGTCHQSSSPAGGGSPPRTYTETIETIPTLDYLFMDAAHSARFARWYLSEPFPRLAAGTHASVHDVFHGTRAWPLTEGAVRLSWLRRTGRPSYTVSAARGPTRQPQVAPAAGGAGAGCQGAHRFEQSDGVLHLLTLAPLPLRKARCRFSGAPSEVPAGVRNG